MSVSVHFNSMKGYLVKTKLPFYHLLLALSPGGNVLLFLYHSRNIYYIWAYMYILTK